MRLNEQRDTLAEAVEAAAGDLRSFRSAVLRKMAAPYGDGSRSNMVNAETDVLPRISDLLDTLATALEAVGRDPDARPAAEPQAIRVW